MTEKGPGMLRRKIFIYGFAFLLFVLGISSIFGKKGLIEIYRTRKSYTALLQDIDRLQKKKARLEKEIAELQKNPGAVDKPAREQLWLMPPDEKVIVKKRK
ncbi:MAG: septum formation initiator family protein [Candidatus Aminicenantes bacterium]|nr:septum formation initiator family protein [Candidatus Aminicenantes bacterium]